MPKIKLIGKTSDHVGKTLWEILGNLKDNGVGRLITRGTHARYPEPSFIKIVKVEPVVAVEDPYKIRKVIAWVEKIFRGQRYPKLIELYRSTQVADYQLIPRDEEETWYKRLAECKPRTKIIDPRIPLPPLLKLIISEEQKAKGQPVDEKFKIPLRIVNGKQNIARLAGENEIPTYQAELGLGTPVSPSLYANIDACRPLFVDREAWEDFRINSMQ